MDAWEETGVVETSTAKVWLGSDGVLRVVEAPGVKVTREDAREELEAMEQVSGDSKRPVLVDIREARSVTNPARKEYSNRIGEVSTAAALVVCSPVSKVLGSFFLRLNRPNHPSKLFTSESKALEWLQGFLVYEDDDSEDSVFWDPRFEEALDVLTQLASGDLGMRGEPSDRGDEIDALMTGINMLGEELQETERQRSKAEQQLRESEEKYRNLVRWMPEAVISADEKRVITEWNEAAEETFGYSRDEALGESTDILVPEDLLERHIEGFKKFLELERAQKPRDYETEALHRNGSRVPLRISFPEKILGQQDRITVVVEDITERKKYEERLRELNQELEVLNRVVRHDIRNDMNVVLGWGELLQGHVDSEGEETLEKILDASRHVVELTEIARDYVNTIVGATSPELKAVNLQNVLSDEVEKRKVVYGQELFQIEGGIPDIEVEANELLSTVFGNILNNAVQHNDKGTPRIRVSAEESDGAVTVSIADNGPGVKDEAKERIFGRGEKGLESQGTGIGLYLVRTLVENYGGEVWVDDNEPKGAVFRIRLRIAGSD